MKHNPQKYYDNHYNINDKAAWEQWQPNPSLIDKQLSQFQGNFWAESLQEIVYSELSLSSHPFDAVLDIGCSTGDFLIPISLSSHQTVGIDIVEFRSPWELVQKDHGIKCQQLNLDESDLPWADAHFDLVTSLAVLEHVFDVHHAISEIVRVLKPGGLVAIQVPNIACIKNRIDLGLGRLPCTANTEARDNLTEWDGQHLHYFTPKTLNSLMKQYGLESYKFKCSGRLSRLRSLHTSLWGADIIVFARKKANMD